AGHGAVEEVVGVGDHARVQDFFAREGTFAIVDGLGVLMAVVADGGGDLGEVVGFGAVEVHVPPGDQRELGGGVEAPAGDELVVGPRPGSGGGAVLVFADLGGGEDDGVAHAGGDRGGGVHDADDAVDVAGPARLGAHHVGEL